jgi:hypothetical protein
MRKTFERIAEQRMPEMHGKQKKAGKAKKDYEKIQEGLPA